MLRVIVAPSAVVPAETSLDSSLLHVWRASFPSELWVLNGQMWMGDTFYC